MPRTEVTFDGHVHAAGRALRDGRGRPIVMRGVGLGNWLLPEGYMWRFPSEGPQSPRQIEAFVRSLVGDEAAAGFWRRFRDVFITEADIERIAALGFDHVRLPMNARLLMNDEGGFLEDGFAFIDRTVEWCRRRAVWVVLDLHGAPGGQTGTNIDDSPRGLPDLFLVGGRYREQTISLWTELARRYRDETVIAAYDLLNEPLPNEHGDRHADRLVELYRGLTAAIRTVDPFHLITYEGTHWSTNWGVLQEPFDPNSLLQFHKYWSAPDRASIAGFVETGRRLGLPIYMGEGGENDIPWLQTAFGLYEDLGISWNFWPWKKVDTITSPVSVTPPAGWTSITEHAAGRGEAPSRDEALATFDELLANMTLRRCEERPGVIGALFHRVPVDMAPEAFSAGGSERPDGPDSPHAGFRDGEGVALLPAAGGERVSWGFEDHGQAPRPRFEMVLRPGDWVEYRVELDAAAPLAIEVPLSNPGDDALGAISVDGLAMESVASNGSIVTTTTTLASGTVHIRLTGERNKLVVRAISVRAADGPVGT
jgi:endoglucanase